MGGLFKLWMANAHLVANGALVLDFRHCVQIKDKKSHASTLA